MSTDKRTIESYDNYAEKWATHMRSGSNIVHEYIEKPAMYRKLPDLKGMKVLCVGCGTGEECAHLLTLGAEKVVGVDISKGLITQAAKSYPDIEFKVMDVEKLDLLDESFDFVYSSLVMHYLDTWILALKEIQRVLKPKGKFLFSTHHPVVWGAERTRTEDERNSLLGYKKYRKTGVCDVFGDYLTSRKIDDVWFGDFPVSYFHRPLSVIMSDIRVSGFEITDFLEPMPDEKFKDVDLMFWEIRRKIPIFMIFELTKPK